MKLRLFILEVWDLWFFRSEASNEAQNRRRQSSVQNFHIKQLCSGPSYLKLTPNKMSVNELLHDTMAWKVGFDSTSRLFEVYIYKYIF